MRDVLIGQTDYTVFVRLASTNGAPVTGLVHTDIDLAYARVETDNDATISDVTPATLASLTAAHSDWGFIEVGSSDHPGLYRLDIADAVFASGAWEAVVTVTDASGTDFYATDIGFRLVGQDKAAATYAANVTHFNGVAGTFSDGRPEVTPLSVDGITYAQAMEILIAVIAGKASVSGNTITYFQRDGTTASIAITYAAPGGTRTLSVIQ